eukprot:4388679-Amphidinium_carterae.1
MLISSGGYALFHARDGNGQLPLHLAATYGLSHEAVREIALANTDASASEACMRGMIGQFQPIQTIVARKGRFILHVFVSRIDITLHQACRPLRVRTSWLLISSLFASCLVASAVAALHMTWRVKRWHAI